MRLKNNRYRKSYEQYMKHFKKEWRMYLLLTAASFVGALFFVAWTYQILGRMSNADHVFHVINPFFILYYGIIKAGGFTFLMGMLVSCAVCYRKFYLDMVDYEYDPRGFPISPRGTYGTSRIMGDEEKHSFLEKTTIDKTNKSVVYKDEKDGSVYVLKDPKSFGPHKFVCGASGSWKTSSMFIPDIMQIIRRGESAICTDPKGELRSKTYRMAQKHNYVVREFNLINPILSDGCDFMKLVESYGDARSFTEVIMMNTSGDAAHNEDFWAKGERAAICFGILYVKEADEYRGKRSFKNVFEFLKQDIGTLNAKADILPEGSNAKNQWAIFQTTPDNSKGGIMTGVATRLQILNDPAIANITGRDEIDITLPGFQPCIYYVIVSDQDTSNNVITSIFFSFLFIKLVKKADQSLGQQLPVTVNFELDEMPNVCKIPEFPKKLSTIRSRNMPCTICAQDIGQMQNLFPGTMWANVISNCDTQVMLGCNDSEITGPFWQKAFGTMTIIVETEKESRDRFKPVNVNNELGCSTGDGRREVFTVGEICGLENKYALIRFRGHNVIQGLKFSYFEHPMFAEIEEENYFTHKPLWWNEVAEEAEGCENLKEYEWFEQGIKELDALNDQLEEELKERKKLEEKIAEEKRAERIVNGGKEEADKADIRARVLFIKRKVTAFQAILHGTSQLVQTTDRTDEDFENAWDAFTTGNDEKADEDAHLGQPEEALNISGNEMDYAELNAVPVLKSVSAYYVEKSMIVPEKETRENRTQKRIRIDIGEEEHGYTEDISARRRGFADSVAEIVNRNTDNVKHMPAQNLYDERNHENGVVILQEAQIPQIPHIPQITKIPPTPKPCNASNVIVDVGINDNPDMQKKLQEDRKMGRGEEADPQKDVCGRWKMPLDDSGSESKSYEGDSTATIMGNLSRIRKRKEEEKARIDGLTTKKTKGL